MNEQDFPAKYQSADALSLRSQKRFINFLRLQLILLLAAPILSILPLLSWIVAAGQLIVLLGGLACSVYLLTQHPERLWYAGRAVAESIKTVTWRYVSRAEPFNTDDASSRDRFLETLTTIIEHNKEFSRQFSEKLDGDQISRVMEAMRGESLSERWEAYKEGRVGDQLGWYAKKAAFNSQRSQYFYSGLVTVNLIAVGFAIFRIRFPDALYWPTDMLVALAADLLAWIQAKRYSELASAYSLAANEIGLIKARQPESITESELSMFVNNAESAFSREHTQWIAKANA